MVKNLAQQGVINLTGVRPQLAKGPTKTLNTKLRHQLSLYRYIWLVYVYFCLSADFDYPRQFSPPLPRIIESLLYVLCHGIISCGKVVAYSETTASTCFHIRRSRHELRYSHQTHVTVTAAAQRSVPKHPPLPLHPSLSSRVIKVNLRPPAYQSAVLTEAALKVFEHDLTLKRTEETKNFPTSHSLTSIDARRSQLDATTHVVLQFLHQVPSGLRLCF
jgi:hypothetical protein